jgi:hypothetical protein
MDLVFSILIICVILGNILNKIKSSYTLNAEYQNGEITNFVITTGASRDLMLISS